VAKATTHKDSAVLTQTLQPVLIFVNGRKSKENRLKPVLLKSGLRSFAARDSSEG
jgi:hypothetical protein